MKALIIDDEALAQDILETHLKDYPEIKLIARCANAQEAKNHMLLQPIDLIFLDIQMPVLNGIDFLKSLENPPIVIITTAYPDHALEGFELNVLDYLLKPISRERFSRAVQKAQEYHQFLQIQSPENELYFFVKADKKMIKVYYQDILYIEGLKDYVIIRMDTQRIITLQTMRSLEEKLAGKGFRRIHRSYIVRLDCIRSIGGNTVEIVEKNTPKKLPVGKNYREELQQLINKNRL